MARWNLSSTASNNPVPHNDNTLKSRANDHNNAALALAFDLDGPTGGAMLNGTLWHKPGYFGLGAYGPYRAVPRILDILSKVDVKATFFTPAWVVEQWPDLCRRILAEGHEIGNHGYRHEVFFGKSSEDQHEILDKCQSVFDTYLGITATGFRAPSGDWAPNTAALLSEYGFIYSSSLRNGDLPYRHEQIPLVELPAKSLFDDYTCFAYHRAPNFPAGLDRISQYGPVFESWGEEISAAAEAGLVVPTIWHPKVIGTPGRALLLEKFINGLVEQDVIPIRTCHTIVEEWAERNPQ